MPPVERCDSMLTRQYDNVINLSELEVYCQLNCYNVATPLAQTRKNVRTVADLITSLRRYHSAFISYYVFADLALTKTKASEFLYDSRRFFSAPTKRKVCDTCFPY